MAQQKSASQIITKVKMKSKGAWKRARKVEPKARGQGGFPPNLDGLVGIPTEHKLAETQKGDPFFTLTFIIASPEEYKGRRATVMWFINESKYATVEQNLELIANDLALIYPKELPQDEAKLIDVLKELCDAGEPVVLKTGGPRKNGGSPNIFIQGLYDGDPLDEEGEGGSSEEEDTEEEPSEENENGDEGDEGGGDEGEGDEGNEEEGEGEEYTPSADDEVSYQPKGEKSYIVCTVTSVDEDAKTVSLKSKLKDKKTKKVRTFTKIGWDKLFAVSE